MTTRSEFLATAQSVEPVTGPSYPKIGPASKISKALPAGIPLVSGISIKITSAKLVRAKAWANEAPTLPAPIIVIFFRAISPPLFRFLEQNSDVFFEGLLLGN